MNTLRISMLRPESGPILAGRLDGKRMFVRELEELPSIGEPTVVLLDFNGIDIATSSFLDEAVIRFRDHLRLGRSNTYLAVANLSEQVHEELEDLLIRGRDALIACTLLSNSRVRNARVLGSLEPKLNATFELVKEFGTASAIELHSASAEGQRVGQTAWNNRLNTLTAKSLLMELGQGGRTKRFKPIMETA